MNLACWNTSYCIRSLIKFPMSRDQCLSSVLATKLTSQLNTTLSASLVVFVPCTNIVHLRFLCMNPSWNSLTYLSCSSHERPPIFKERKIPPILKENDQTRQISLIWFDFYTRFEVAAERFYRRLKLIRIDFPFDNKKRLFLRELLSPYLCSYIMLRNKKIILKLSVE